MAVAASGALLAIVDEGGLAVSECDEHEAATAKVARDGMHDGQREAGGHGGIDGVAAVFQDFHAGIGRLVMDADDHRVFRPHRLLLGGSDYVFAGVVGRGILRAQRGKGAEQAGDYSDGGGSRRHSRPNWEHGRG